MKNGDFLLVLPVKKEKNWRRRRQAGGLKEERKEKGGAGKEKEGLDRKEKGGAGKEKEGLDNSWGLGDHDGTLRGLLHVQKVRTC